MTRGKLLAFTFFILAALGGLGWWQRGAVAAWWYVRELAQADDEGRASCARVLASLGEDAVGPLLSALNSHDASACRNLELGLRAVVGDWSADDPRALRTMEAVRAAFAGLSIEGKRATLQFAAAFAGREGHASLPANLARVFGELMAAGEQDDVLRPAILGLAGALIERAPAGQWKATCHRLARTGFAHKDAATRVAAIQLVLRESLRADNELLAEVVPLLRDSNAGVRRVAILALGPNVDVVREEHLLPLLHDAEPEIQHLCEVVLRSRGLNDLHIQMARLISDADPSVRLQVMPLMRRAADLDMDVWLRRLTLDPAPAVRAAAARVAGGEPSDDLRQRLGEMAQSDPSETVREIARFYMDRQAYRKVGN
jgi:HEAT repeat protein